MPVTRKSRAPAAVRRVRNAAASVPVSWVQPWVRTRPSRQSSATTTRPVSAAIRPTRPGAAAQVERRRDLVGRSDSAADLELQAGHRCQAPQQPRVLVGALAGAGRVEIDDVQPARAGGRVAQGQLDRFDRVRHGPVVPALVQSHDPAAEKIDGRQNQPSRKVDPLVPC